MSAADAVHLNIVFTIFDINTRENFSIYKNKIQCTFNLRFLTEICLLKNDIFEVTTFQNQLK